MRVRFEVGPWLGRAVQTVRKSWRREVRNSTIRRISTACCCDWSRDARKPGT